jgi:transcriptional regulator with XRE-family HTH domain
MRDTKTLATRVAFARALAEDLSARELDRIAGLHQGHTWAIESGERDNIERDTARKLAAALGVTVGWLLENEGARPTSNEVCAAVRRARASADEHKAAS